MVSFSETGSPHIKVYKNYKVKPSHEKYNELKGKKFKIQIGNITLTPCNNFYYYEPPSNTSKPVLIDGDLETLKKKVTNRRNGLC